MRVGLAQLTRRFGALTAVDSLDLEIESGEFVALLGPSGCGKTTALLLLAGIYRPTSGAIVFGDRRVEHLPPKERGVGMVFQSYALYPHMTVEQNIAFPLEVRRGLPGAERWRRVRQAAELVQVGDLLERRPAQLSGGQQQRVALARALVKQPDILLLDEPLSNLDARLRQAMRGEIKRLQKDLGVTAIFVTHDQVEALSMADRVALMRGGRLQAYGTPAELYERPCSRFVAEFIGSLPMNFLPVELIDRHGSLAAVSDGLALELPARLRERLHSGGTTRAATLGVRAEDLALEPAGRGQLTGDICLVEPMGREQVVEVRHAASTVRVLVPLDFGARIGDRVGIGFDVQRLHLFDPASGESLG